MSLQREAIVILQVFGERGCKAGDFLAFADFGKTIIWQTDGVRDESIQQAIQVLLDGDYLLEHKAGFEITARGFQVINT